MPQQPCPCRWLQAQTKPQPVKGTRLSRRPRRQVIPQVMTGQAAQAINCTALCILSAYTTEALPTPAGRLERSAAQRPNCKYWPFLHLQIFNAYMPQPLHQRNARMQRCVLSVQRHIKPLCTNAVHARTAPRRQCGMTGATTFVKGNLRNQLPSRQAHAYRVSQTIFTLIRHGLACIYCTCFPV